MKFLSSSFREAMSDFFGKAGMPWHGVMFIRRPHGDEKVEDGEFVVSYIDAMMNDKKEDGFATLSAVYLAIKKYKEDSPWIDVLKGVKTDGAGAYAGIVFSTGLSLMYQLAEVRVDNGYTGVAGKGKSQLDAHFAVKGGQTRRLVAAAMHDIITPETLYEGVKKTMGTNESVQLFQPDRSAGSSLDAKSVKGLGAMSHRSYEYEVDGTFTHIVLRQQTDLGEGLRIAADSLRKEGQPAFSFAKPRMLASAGSASTAQPSASAAATAAAAAAAKQGASRGASSSASTPSTSADADDPMCGSCTDEDATTSDDASNSDGARKAKLPIARTKEGRELLEKQRARKAEKRRTAKSQRGEAERAADIKRCNQSKAYWCKTDANGDFRCNRVFTRPSSLKKHIAKGRHTEGAVRPFRAGAEAGRGTARDRTVGMVQAALQGRVRPDARTLAPGGTLVPADAFAVRFADDIEYEQEPPESGWARAQRLPAVRVSVAQLEFIVNGKTVGESFDQIKLLPADARQMMADMCTVAGMAKVALRFKGHPYFDPEPTTPPRFRRSEVLDEPKIKAYFGKPTSALNKQLENARKRGEVVESEDSADEDEDEEGGDGRGGRPKKKRKKKRKKGEGGGGRRSGVDTDKLRTARDKMASYHTDDPTAAASGNSRHHLNVDEMRALLSDAGQPVSGRRPALVARVIEHAALLRSRAQAAAPAANAGGDGDGGAGGGAVGDAGDSGAGVADGSGDGDAGGGGDMVVASGGGSVARAKVASGDTELSSLRTAHLPSGLTLTAPKAAKLGGVWRWCHEFADATDSELRGALRDGRLAGVGLEWLRRLHTALAHLRRAEGGSSDAMQVDEPPSAMAASQPAVANREPEGAAAAASDVAKGAAGGAMGEGSASAMEGGTSESAAAASGASSSAAGATMAAASDSSSSESESESDDSDDLGSAVGTDADAEDSDGDLSEEEG